VPLYTRTGDRGETRLLDGSRVPKSDPRVEAYGDIDELNAWLGFARTAGLDAELARTLDELQRDLFAVGAQLADPRRQVAGRVAKVELGEEHVRRLEAAIDRLEADLPPLRRFILPGGSPAGAALHVARTICRRAERRIVALGVETVPPVVLAYLNRLSDLLFVLARTANHRAGAGEGEW
jgi:cob(I)alamin adenosyltransferase